MRGRSRAFTKKELDDRPFNCPVKGNKQAKLKKLWVGEVVESDEGWCSGGTIHETIHGTIRRDLFPRDNSRVSEASLSSGLGEEEGLAGSQKKDVKHVVTSTNNGFEPVVKLETSEGIRTPFNTWENSDRGANGGSEDQKILEEHRAESPLSPLPVNCWSLSPPKSNSLRCSLSPPPPNPNSPGEVSTYISYYLRRNLAHGKKSNALQSFPVRLSVPFCLFFLSREVRNINGER